MSRRPLPRSLLLVPLILTGCARAPDPLPGFPPLVLWAWEHSEDLRLLDSDRVGVAFLASTILLHDGAAFARPRLQPLKLRPETALIAVVRMESRGALPSVESTAVECLRASAFPHVRALQIDFDAKESQRDWYRRLLHRLRAELPASRALTITALASWCVNDRWIHDLPVSEAVPMLFEMGPQSFLKPGDIREPLCRSSLGISTNEFPPSIPPGPRLYCFHRGPWTPEALANLRARLKPFR